MSECIWGSVVDEQENLVILIGCNLSGGLLVSFPRIFGGVLVWGGYCYWEVMGLGFLSHNVGEIYFLSPVDISDRNVAVRKVCNLFSSASSSLVLPLLVNLPLYVKLCGMFW